MKYYVAADVHGYFDALKESLAQQGFFADTGPHKLILCGDLFDRGGQALALQQFVLDLMERDEIILIRGNHEDLLLQLLNGWHRGEYLRAGHISNGTVDTVCQLTGADTAALLHNAEQVGRELLHSPLVQAIIPTMLDYYETDHYIFVHGWIPCMPYRLSTREMAYVPIPGWRQAAPDRWAEARWINGMEAAHDGVLEKGKTIVCGHWHCSFGHAKYERRGSEFGADADFSPYRANGILALDGCTVQSGKVNCVCIED